ncbi:hypothetical protein [Cupriavidus sp. UME77]|uniref:hypothetical protein n=1 Tax=Cupriavidus sp. UME77 TaxID=1862321 RepID=UPI001D38888E|nr:hypothetical protein [Cupriavidus sp. UME77]MBB1631081.1 hypothetical protein [Cupriavidus sp. UME77]
MATRTPRDPNGRYVKVYVTLIYSPAWRVLGPSAVKLFMDLRATVTGTNNGNLNAALSEMKHRGWASSATLAKALYELRAMGFLAVTREGGLKMGTRVCTLYRFTDLEVFEQPKVGVQHIKATHDYRRFESVRDAERALTEGFEKLRAEGGRKQAPKKKAPVQKLNPISSEIESIGRFIASQTEQAAAVSLQ